MTWSIAAEQVKDDQWVIINDQRVSWSAPRERLVLINPTFDGRASHPLVVSDHRPIFAYRPVRGSGDWSVISYTNRAWRANGDRVAEAGLAIFEPDGLIYIETP